MAERPKNAAPQTITFEVKPEVEGGVYSNAASIVHNHNEFIFDFAMIVPGKSAAPVRARVVTSPLHAKQFLAALAENIAGYEMSFGEIKAAEPAPSKETQTLH